ncbi:hypothetical protein ACHAPU_000730 [Fusarium lateritium]
MYDAGLKVTNAWGSLIWPAHLYNAVTEEGCCDCFWPDMEQLFDMFGDEQFFVGGKPQNIPDYATRFMLQVGVSASSLTSSRRPKQTSIDDFFRAGARFLTTRASIHGRFKARYQNNANRMNWTQESINQILVMAEKAGDAKERNKDKKKKRKKNEPKSKAAARISPIELLGELGEAMGEEIEELAFPYLIMHRSNWELMDLVRTTYQPLLMSWYGSDFVQQEWELPFLVGHILTQAETSASILIPAGKVIDLINTSGTMSDASKQMYRLMGGDDDVSEEIVESLDSLRGSGAMDMEEYSHESDVDSEDADYSKPLDDFLERNTLLQIIILQWVDVCGVLRSRLLPVATFRKIVDSGGHLECAPLDTCVPTTADFIPNIMPYFGHKGKIWPDISTLRIAHDGSGLGNAAICFGGIEFENSDARSILKAVVDRAKESDGLAFLVGMELEFCLLIPGTLDPAEPAPPGVAGTSRTLRSKVWPFLNEAIIALTDAGVGVEQSVKEYGTSAYEIALSPLPPIEAVDAYVYATELIKNVAYKHGLVATFYPTPYDGDIGQKNGEHIHISATSTNESWDPDTAMAGILSHIPALTALGMAQVDSYERVGIGRMGAGGLVGWGGNNRDMPVRRVTNNHWEMRVNDGTSNPYAMVAGIIGAALDPKPLQIKEASRFTLMYSEEEKQQLGLTKPLPTTLEAALEELENDRAWACSVLGEEYVEWFLALKKAEMKTVSDMDVQERRLFMLNYF